jgi:hypothetical protein
MYDGIFNITIKIEDADGDEMIDVMAFIMEYDGTYLIKFEEGNGVCYECYLDMMETEEVFKMFMTDYLNPDITFDQINMMYFNGYAMNDIEESRTVFLEEGYTVEFISIDYAMYYDSFFDIYLEVAMGQETEQTTSTVRIMSTDNGYMIEFMDGKDDDCDGICDYLTSEEILEVYMMYLSDYLNPEVTFEYLNEMYFDYMYDPMYDDWFTEERQMYIDGGYMITVVSVEDYYQDDPFKLVTLEYTSDEDTYTMEFEVRVNRIEMARYAIEEYSFYDYQNDPVYNFSMFLENLHMENINVDQICMEYFHSDSIDVCRNILLYHLENNYTAYVSNVTYVGERLEIEITTIDAEYNMIEDYVFDVEYYAMDGADSPLFKANELSGEMPLYE